MYRIDVIYKEKEKNYFLILDGIEVAYDTPNLRDSPYLIWRKSDKSLELSTNKEELSLVVSNVPLASITPEINELTIFSGDIPPDEEVYLWYFSVERGETGWEFSTTIGFRSENWKNPFSIKNFVTEFRALYDGKFRFGFRGLQEDQEDDIYAESFIDVSYPITDHNSTLSIEIQKNRPSVEVLIEDTFKSLYSKLDENSLVQHFRFPEGLQGPCEEYLWTFIQFLKEVGIEATAELKQDKIYPGKVLFAVTPSKGKAVLGKVKQALELYIELAGASNFEFDPNAPIAALMLESQVRHFQSQFALAQAQARTVEAENRALKVIAQAQEATILAQRTTVENVTANNVFLLAQVQAWEDEKAKKDKDEISLLRGIVKLGDYRLNPFTISIPRFLAETKRIMQDDSIPAVLREDVGLPALPPHDDNPRT